MPAKYAELPYLLVSDAELIYLSGRYAEPTYLPDGGAELPYLPCRDAELHLLLLVVMTLWLVANLLRQQPHLEVHVK